MRELRIHSKTAGDTIVPVAATAPTLLYYSQEFGMSMMHDFVGVLFGALRAFPQVKGLDLASLAGIELDVDSVTAESAAEAEFDLLAVMRLVWAMGRAAAFPEPWPTFERWLNELPKDAELLDTQFLSAALEVAADGLFRRPGR